jgi:hypothetical protein
MEMVVSNSTWRPQSTAQLMLHGMKNLVRTLVYECGSNDRFDCEIQHVYHSAGTRPISTN